MSDAVERLRVAASLPDHVMDGFAMVQTEHLRELLALHDEAVRVLGILSRRIRADPEFPHALCGESTCVMCDELRQADAFLAKAGGK